MINNASIPAEHKENTNFAFFPMVVIAIVVPGTPIMQREIKSP